MQENSKSGLVGAMLIGLGCGLTAVGLAMVIPACTNWTLEVMDEAFKRGRNNLSSGIETAASFAGHLSETAQRKFGEASKNARDTTSKAAGVVERAARRVREQTS